MTQAEQIAEINAIAEQSYNRLDGEWLEWLEVARKYEHKVPSQERLDIRHTIILELYHARQRDGNPLPLLRAYRIASLTVALYWRQRNKPLVRVCVISGIAKEPNNAECGFSDKPARCRDCPFLAVRPIQSLDTEYEDMEGNKVRLLETVADDKAIDLVAKLDASTFLLGCPMRLIEIATKKLDGKALNVKDRMYLSRFRRQEQKRLV